MGPVLAYWYVGQPETREAAYNNHPELVAVNTPGSGVFLENDVSIVFGFLVFGFLFLTYSSEILNAKDSIFFLVVCFSFPFIVLLMVKNNQSRKYFFFLFRRD